MLTDTDTLRSLCDTLRLQLHCYVIDFSVAFLSDLGVCSCVADALVTALLVACA